MNGLAATRLGGLLTLAVVAIGCDAVAGLATPSGAAAKNACEVLTRSEIANVFRGTVSDGKKGTTATGSRCEYEVGASGDRPDGVVIVHVVLAGAKAAYDDLKTPGSGYTTIAGSNTLYNETLRIVDVLAGDVLVGVQGIFVNDVVVPVPAHFYDVQSELVELARLAVKRV